VTRSGKAAIELLYKRYPLLDRLVLTPELKES